MKIENKTLIKVERADQVVEMYVPNNMSLPTILDCIFEMRGYVLQRLNEIHEQDKKKDNPEVEVKPELPKE